jgi:hypothetical protein
MKYWKVELQMASIHENVSSIKKIFCYFLLTNFLEMQLMDFTHVG